MTTLWSAGRSAAGLAAGLALCLAGGSALAADEPVQDEIGMEIPIGAFSQCKTITTVPAGKRLVVESVSLDVSPGPGTSGQNLVSTVLRPKLDGKTISFNLTPTLTPDLGFVDSRLVRLYADSTLRFCASRSGPAVGVWSFVVGISGVLSDVP
jgi:hypothetical protein